MSHIFPRLTTTDIPVVARGDGVYLHDVSGKRYIDGSSGPATSCLGHSDEAVTAAIKAQLDKVAFAHTSYFTSDAAESVADMLAEHAPPGIDRVYLVSGGSEAVEACLKLARQYFVERGEMSRHRVIARRQSYHGNTLGALATGGNQLRREAFGPLLMDSRHISPCYEYRLKQDDESSFDYGQRMANELEDEIHRLGPENVMAFVAEPVVGATAGALPPVEGYFKRIRDICDQYGVLLILDEVMCGMGRTGTLFACEQDGISPDIMSIAKGLGAGYQPIGAMLCSEAIYQTIARGSGFFQHGHTYLGHPAACAGALAVLHRLITDGVVEQGRRISETFIDRLHSEFAEHPHVGDIRGRGLFQGLEIVEDRQTREPFAPGRQMAKRIKKAAFDAGLICYPGSGTIDGRHGDHILLAPPFIITTDHVDEIIDKLSQAFDNVL